MGLSKIYWLNRLALSKSDVAVADPLESTLGDKVLGCSFLIVAQKP